MRSRSLLEIQRLSVFLGTQTLVTDISFEVAQGEVLALYGPSGAGKSTVLNAVAGILHPTLRSRGRIVIDGQEITNAPPEIRGRQGISLVPQSLALFPRLTALENIAYPLKCRGMRTENALIEAKILADMFNLNRVTDNKPDQLSGGQQQRVALARALISHPKAILLDEPLKGLDDQLRDDLMILIYKLKEKGVALLLVTHSRREVSLLSDRVVFIESGQIRHQAETQSILRGSDKKATLLNEISLVPNGKDCFVPIPSDALTLSNNNHQRETTTLLPEAKVLLKQWVGRTRCAVLLEFPGDHRTWWSVDSAEIEELTVGNRIQLLADTQYLNPSDG